MIRNTTEWSKDSGQSKKGNIFEIIEEEEICRERNRVAPRLGAWILKEVGEAI